MESLGGPDYLLSGTPILDHLPTCPFARGRGHSPESIPNLFMKINTISFACAVAISTLLCSCAGSTNGVNITPQSTVQYAPVPVANVRVSSHPPKGQYTVIALLTIDAQIGETPTHVLKRLQQTGASIGADYVMVTSVGDRTYLTPQTVDDQNVYLDTQRDFDSTAGSSQVYATTYMREIIKGQALKMTSGSNVPNKAAPSMLWQVRDAQQ